MYQKAVTLLSSQHHEAAVSIQPHKKPLIIENHNETKGGVDRLNQMVSTLTCKRKTRRWPLALFFNMLDVSWVAAQVIWHCNFPDWEKHKNSRRRIFLTELVGALVSKHIQRRMANSKDLTRTAISALRTLGFHDMREKAPEPKAVKSRCYLYPRGIDHNVRQVCRSRSNKVCGEHSTKNLLCDDCLDE